MKHSLVFSACVVAILAILSLVLWPFVLLVI